MILPDYLLRDITLNRNMLLLMYLFSFNNILQSYFLKSRDVDEVIKCMDEVVKQGYQGELDLFVARVQLDLIARYDGFEGAQKIKKHFIQGEQTPIINFTDML